MFEGGGPTTGTGGRPARQPAASAAYKARRRARFSTCRSITEPCSSARASSGRDKPLSLCDDVELENRVDFRKSGLIVCRRSGTAIARLRLVQRCFSVEDVVRRRLSGFMLAALLVCGLSFAAPLEARQGHVHASGGVAVSGGYHGHGHGHVGVGFYGGYYGFYPWFSWGPYSPYWSPWFYPPYPWYGYGYPYYPQISVALDVGTAD